MEVNYIFILIGIFTLLRVGWKIIVKAYLYWHMYFFPTYKNFSTYGKWSVVTGSADGLGKAIASQLASKGQNIVLIDINAKGLSEVSKELASKYSIETKTLQIDFTNDEAIYTKIEEFLKDLDIGVLVNNVGISTTETMYLDTPDLSKVVKNMTSVNMFSVLKMTQIVLPGMVLRRRGLILNISSYATLLPCIGAAIYGATKSFVRYFSETLSYEYEDKGITVHTCIPGVVRTNMTKHLPLPAAVPVMLPDEYAASLLGTIGKERVTHGCWKHDLQVVVESCIPFFLKLPIGRRILKELERRRENNNKSL